MKLKDIGFIRSLCVLAFALLYLIRPPSEKIENSSEPKTPDSGSLVANPIPTTTNPDNEVTVPIQEDRVVSVNINGVRVNFSEIEATVLGANTSMKAMESASTPEERTHYGRIYNKFMSELQNLEFKYTELGLDAKLYGDQHGNVNFRVSPPSNDQLLRP